MSAIEKPLREAIEACVNAAIEGDDCELRVAVANMARVAGVTYEAVECHGCGDWVDANTACAVMPSCRRCGVYEDI